MRIPSLPILLFLSMIAACGRAEAQAAPQTTPPSIDGPGSTLSQSPRPRPAHASKLPYGLPLMARFDLLPMLRDTKCVQDSSYDRSGGNGDAGNFFRKEGSTAVLADIRGPGCIYRFWSANAAGHLRIYFDGETTPRIDCPMQDLFLAKVTPFEAPLVGHKSGGWYCFFPMPFRKSCRIEVTDPGSLYYHVEYQLFPDGTPIRTFTRTLTPDDQKALTTILAQWAHFGTDPKSLTLTTNRIGGQVICPAGQTRVLGELNGPAEVTALRMKIDPASRFSLRQTVLRVYWDGAAKPGIEAPLGDFFGAGFGDQRFTALPDAMTDDGYVCYWPMPFARSARFEIANAGANHAISIVWSVAYGQLSQPLPDAGYFHAQWHRQTTVAGEHFHILQTTGRGHYVGEHTDMQGDRGIWFLEGDEKIYVDGETFPSIYGTGTEDFYTGGWYFDEGPFNLAYHGCILKDESLSRVAAYRYQIQDCVPFQHDLKVDIEHGGMNDYPGADYSCVAYWYQTTPDHDWSPIDTAQLTPARFKVAGVLEAENLTWQGGKAEPRDDSALLVEASGGKVMAVSGENPTVTFSVDADDVYKVQLSQLRMPDSPDALKWILDRVETGSPGSSEWTNGGAAAKEGRWETETAAVRLKPGAHTLTLAVPTGRTVYLDYLRLLPSRKEAGVVEAESLVDKTDTGGKGRVQRVDGGEAWSGASALRWWPQNEGDTLKLPISVDRDGDYALELGVVRNADSPIITAQLDAANLETQDLSDPNGKDATQRIPFGRATGVKQGAHTLTLIYKGKNPAAQTPALMLDYLRLIKSLYPYTVEAEGLTILEAKDGDASRQEMAVFGPHWSGDAQFWLVARSAGAEATLELPVYRAGRYNLAVYFTTARDYAIVQTLLDGRPAGPPVDTYTPDVLAKGRTLLGTVTLSAGAHRITFRAVGKNPASSSYLIGVDAIGLEPIKGP